MGVVWWQKSVGGGGEGFLCALHTNHRIYHIIFQGIYSAESEKKSRRFGGEDATVHGANPRMKVGGAERENRELPNPRFHALVSPKSHAEQKKRSIDPFPAFRICISPSPLPPPLSLLSTNSSLMLPNRRGSVLLFLFGKTLSHTHGLNTARASGLSCMLPPPFVFPSLPL